MRSLLDTGVFATIVTLGLTFSAFLGYAGYLTYFSVPVEFLRLDFATIAKFWTGILGLKVAVFGGVLGGMWLLTERAIRRLIGDILAGTTTRLGRKDSGRILFAVLIACVVPLSTLFAVIWSFRVASKYLSTEALETLLFLVAVLLLIPSAMSIRAIRDAYNDLAETYRVREQMLATLAGGVEARRRLGWRYQLPARGTIASFVFLFYVVTMFFLGWTEAESGRDYYVFAGDVHAPMVVMRFRDDKVVGYGFRVCHDKSAVLMDLRVVEIKDEVRFTPVRFERALG